jgi:hypothetical protein
MSADKYRGPSGESLGQVSDDVGGCFGVEARLLMPGSTAPMDGG